jgi:hypothetical protein
LDTLSLHDALPIWADKEILARQRAVPRQGNERRL